MECSCREVEPGAHWRTLRALKVQTGELATIAHLLI